MLCEFGPPDKALSKRKKPSPNNYAKSNRDWSQVVQPWALPELGGCPQDCRNECVIVLIPNFTSNSTKNTSGCEFQYYSSILSQDREQCETGHGLVCYNPVTLSPRSSRVINYQCILKPAELVHISSYNDRFILIADAMQHDKDPSYDNAERTIV